MSLREVFGVGDAEFGGRGFNQVIDQFVFVRCAGLELSRADVGGELLAQGGEVVVGRLPLKARQAVAFGLC